MYQTILGHNKLHINNIFALDPLNAFINNTLLLLLATKSKCIYISLTDIFNSFTAKHMLYYTDWVYQCLCKPLRKSRF